MSFLPKLPDTIKVNTFAKVIFVFYIQNPFSPNIARVLEMVLLHVMLIC